MRSTKQIKHIGIISDISGNIVTVNVERSSACAGCHSRSACTFMDSQLQQIKCESFGKSFKIGDKVCVKLNRSQGVEAVFFVFIVPLLLLIFAIAVSSSFFKLSEGISAIIGILAITVYYVILHFFEKKISNKIKFTIEKI